MNIKLKTLINITLVAFIAAIVSSCFKTDVDPKIYTAAEEQALRNAYIDRLISEDIDIDTTANGVYYVVLDEGEGDFAMEGDSLVVGYAGTLIDGMVFDRSIWHFEDGKMGFVLGKDSLIAGWEEGMQVMNEGSRVQFIIPSELAYGSKGNVRIPPYQTLIFVVKLFEINPE